MKPTRESTARVEESPPELEPVSASYLEPEPTRERSDDSAEWLWLLWERRGLLGRAAVWGLIVTTLIAVMIPNRYESTVRLMPPDSQSGSGLAMMAAMIGGAKGATTSGLGSLAGDLLGMKSSGALFTEILRTRTVQDRLVERFDLRRVYSVRYWVDARKVLSDRTEISEDRKSGVITVIVSDRDPHRAAQLAQAYVEELDRLVAQVSTSSARRERIFIEQRLQTVKQDLDKVSRQFSEYASQNTTIDLTAQGKATVEAAAQLEGELIATQSELDGLEQIYTKGNVRVRSLQARVDELRSQLHKIGGESSTAVSDGAASGQEFPSIRQLPLLGVKWGDLYRATKIQETVFELLTQQYELAKIQEAKEIPTVKTLDTPNTPEKKSSPHRLVLIILGVLFALSGAIVWILGEATWRRMDPDDLRKHLAQEVFAGCAALWARCVGIFRTRPES